MRSSTFVALALLVAAAGSVEAQTRAASASTAPSGRYIAIGCLSRQGTGAGARYVVTDPRGEAPTVYRVQGDSAQLARHVGHTVEVAGALARTGASGPYTLTMNTLSWIASTCTVSAARSGVRPTP